MDRIKILIADDHQVVRKGITTLLEDEEDIEIVGEATDGLDAIEKIRLYNPNIVLMDIAMPKMTGIEATKVIVRNHMAVKSLIFSMHNNEDYIVKSVESGAWGYILKDTSKEEMLLAIRKVASGEKYFTHQVTNVIVETWVNNPKKAPVKKDEYAISKKEKIILKYLVEGLSSREIAEKLGLSIRTVDNHRSHIMKKTGVSNSAKLIKLTLSENLV